VPRWLAILVHLQITFTLLYVLPFYLSPATRPSPTLNRDAPSVIRARIQAVTLACLVASISTLTLIVHTTRHSPVESLHLLGWYPIHLSSIFGPLALTTTLFTGPLFERLFIERIDPSTTSATLLSWIGYRNFVAGPITEEVLFRSVLVPIHLLAKVSPTTTTFITPLYFGIAHIHHFYEFSLTHPHTPLLPILLRSIFQFTYTTLFGWFAAFVYIRSGSLYTVIIIHTFCNWIGFPRFWGRVQRKENLDSYGPTKRAQNDPMTDSTARWTPKYSARSELNVLWTVLYYVLLVAGAYGFYVGLWPLTASGNALADFGAATGTKWSLDKHVSVGNINGKRWASSIPLPKLSLK
jgi:prenyl protein peptidase